MVVAVASGLSLAGCSTLSRSVDLAACPRPVGALVTPAAAKAAVAADDAVNNRANAALDLAIQDGHEAGAAAVLDDASFVLDHALATPGPATFTHSDLRVGVAFQTAYPLSFVVFGHYDPGADASTTTTVTPTPGPRPTGDRILVYDRQSASTPWKNVAAVTLPAGVPTPTLATDCNGFALAVAAFDPSLAVPPGSLATRLARYLTANAASGATPSDLLGGAGSTAILAGIRAAAAYDALLGATLSYSAAPGDFPTAAWRTAEGGALVMLAVSGTYRVKPIGRGPIVQPVDRSVWNQFLDPGTYPEASFHDLSIVGAIIPRADRGAQVGWIASNSGFVSAGLDPCRLLSAGDAGAVLGATATVDARRDPSGDVCDFTTPHQGRITVTTAPAPAGQAPGGTPLTGLSQAAGYAETSAAAGGGTTGSVRFVSSGTLVTVAVTLAGSASPQPQARQAAQQAIATARSL